METTRQKTLQEACKDYFYLAANPRHFCSKQVFLFFFFAFFPKSLSDGLRWNERDFAASVITERVLIFASNVQYPFFITGCLVPLSKPPVMWTKPQQQTPQSSHQNRPVSQGCSNSAKSPLQKKEITEKVRD